MKKIKNNRIFAMWLAIVVCIVQSPFTALASVTTYSDIELPSDVSLRVIAPYGDRVERGREHIFTAVVTSPGTAISGTIRWEVTGSTNSGTNIINTTLSPIEITTGGGIKVPATLRVSDNEMTNVLTVRAILESNGEIIVEDTTDVHTVRRINLLHEGDIVGNLLDFGERLPGYGSVTAAPIQIANPHNSWTGQLTVSLTGEDADSFILRGGQGNSPRERTIQSIGPYTPRDDAFSIAPRNGLEVRTTPYSVRVTVSGTDIWHSFEAVFSVVNTTTTGDGVFTLTLMASSGGDVSLDGSRFDTVRTARIREGSRVSIEARAYRDYVFDRWSYSYGDILSGGNFTESTTFIMPSRNVTVWAEFNHFSDRDWVWEWNHVSYAGFPEAPQFSRASLDAPPVPRVASVSTATPNFTPLSTRINGRLFEHQSVLIAGVSYIPAMEVFNEIGYDVAWNEGTRTATFSRNNRVMVTEGESHFTINGDNRAMSAAAIVVDGVLMVPYLEIIEAIGGIAHRNTNNAISIFVTLYS